MAGGIVVFGIGGDAAWHKVSVDGCVEDSRKRVQKWASNRQCVTDCNVVRTGSAESFLLFKTILCWGSKSESESLTSKEMGLLLVVLMLMEGVAGAPGLLSAVL